MTPVLSETQLRRLEEHKYSMSGVSVTERVLEVLWSWLVQKLPMWVAPNLLTMAGFLINVVTSLLLIIFYSPTAKEEAPAWVYAVCAVGWFLYQCLDGMDGKQARRTGSSTPLGELFDHGSDAVSTVLLSIATACAMKLGQTPDLMFFMIFLTMFVFYCTHWESHVSGTVKCELIDVVEAQSFSVIVQALSALLGPSFWYKFPQPIVVAAFFSIVGASLWKLHGNFRTILSEKNFSILSPGFAGLFPIVLACITYGTSPELFLNHPCLYLLMFGLAIAKVNNKLIVAHITKSEMTALDSSMVGPGVLFLSQCCGSFVSGYAVLWICLIFVTCDLVLYCFLVCTEICSHLDIYPFSITSKPSQT
ncbi:choline/ethanolaminephosphotransferase 1-like isoform X3 [Branchiostoma floridae]|uniref:Choline/ethanolaminephosphotransferase 1-like isoform X3 n=1 Tax=Branchiostoma floridae TaxID=7739 RepID=A0A9J7MNK7_BRAFL|nr:choline/ethanolaminephosphotransferase 1-like isoform X3 [Branchiostoma floridae]